VNARDEVLSRVAAAHQAAPPAELPYDAIERHYRTTATEDQASLVERFTDRLEDYRAAVRQCGPGDVAATVQAALTDRGARVVVCPADLPETWLSGAEVDIRRDGLGDDRIDVAELDRADGVVTTCTVAIAETGTLVLDGSAGTGRRVLTLIPDYHLVVVFAEQICADVPQAVAQLEPTRPLTWISGPSATSDIELNRVEGVHGPRTLEVVIVADHPALGSDAAET